MFKLKNFLTVKSDINSTVFYTHLIIYIGFCVWGFSFLRMDFTTNEIGHSFMHNINLVFHEAGHILFIPFGHFLMVAGGSLMQMIMPIIVIIAFIWQNNDNFGASLAFWWLGQSIMDMGPYINDARALQLQLVGGGTGQDRPGAHDWEYLLTRTGLIEHERMVAHVVDKFGALVMIVALIWGAILLRKQWRVAQHNKTFKGF